MEEAERSAAHLAAEAVVVAHGVEAMVAARKEAAALAEAEEAEEAAKVAACSTCNLRHTSAALRMVIHSSSCRFAASVHRPTLGTAAQGPREMSAGLRGVEDQVVEAIAQRTFCPASMPPRKMHAPTRKCHAASGAAAAAPAPGGQGLAAPSWQLRTH